VRATDSQGALVQGDIRAQTRRALENLDARLRAAGSSLRMAASLNVYLKNAGDFAAMNEVYRGFWPKDPPARTTIVAAGSDPAALVEIAAVAVPESAPRQVIHPSDWMPSPNPYSYGILSGDTLFLAGLVSRNGKDNQVVAGDVALQTRTVMANAAEILKAAGMSHADVVQSRVYITDTAIFQEMNSAYRATFPKDPPVRATVKAALMSPQYLVEITMVAVKGRREALTAPNADGTPGTPNPNLSSAVRVGDRLWLSGMLGNTPATKDDAAAQTRETLARLGRALTAAGFAWEHVAEGVVYATDSKHAGAIEAVWRERFPQQPPAGVRVETGLVAPDGLVEIMLSAAKKQ
jgi:2-iminobutanoate/2-iminopropanoate deaminase